MEFSGSQVFSGMFAVMKERFWSLLGIWATFLGIQIAMGIVFGIVAGMSAMAGMSTNDPASMGVGMILGMVVFYFVSILVAMAQNGSLLAMAAPLRRIAFGDALSIGMRSALPLIGVFLVLMLAYLGGALLIALLVGLFSLAGSSVGGVAGVIAVLLILPGIVYLGCRLATVFPVVVIEQVRNPVAAIRRGWDMTRGHAMKIFLVSLAFAIGALILLAVFVLPFVSSIMSAEASGGAPDLGAMGLMFVGLIVFSIVIALASAAFMASLNAALSGGTDDDLEGTFA